MKTQVARLQMVSVLFSALLGACGSGDSSSSAITGKNMSGTYDYVGVACYDADMNLTGGGVWDAFSPIGRITITGNSYSYVFEALDCSVTTTGTLSFSEQSSTADYSIGMFTMSPASVSVSGTSPCLLSFDLFPFEGSPVVEPLPLDLSISNSSSFVQTDEPYFTFLSSGKRVFFYRSEVLGLSGRPSDVCYLMFGEP